jgi:hypothetical protein
LGEEFNPFFGRHFSPDLTERKKIVRLGLPRIIRLKRKCSRTRLQFVLCDDWHGNTGCLVA